MTDIQIIETIKEMLDCWNRGLITDIEAFNFIADLVVRERGLP